MHLRNFGHQAHDPWQTGDIAIFFPTSSWLWPPITPPRHAAAPSALSIQRLHHVGRCHLFKTQGTGCKRDEISETKMAWHMQQSHLYCADQLQCRSVLRLSQIVNRLFWRFLFSFSPHKWGRFKPSHWKIHNGGSSNIISAEGLWLHQRGCVVWRRNVCVLLLHKFNAPREYSFASAMQLSCQNEFHLKWNHQIQ